MKHAIFALCAVAASLASAQLPDFPLIYSPAVHGPVQNPAYTRAHSPSSPAAQPAAQAAPLPEAPTPGATRPRPRYLDPSCYTLALHLAYGFSAAPDSKFSCDNVGFEIEGAYYFAPRQAFTLSLGFSGGGKTRDFWVQEPSGSIYPFTDSFDRYSFTLMGGYRYSLPLGRRWVFELGAKCGMDVQTLEVDYGYGWSGWPYSSAPGRSNTAVGMAYAGYAAIGYIIHPNATLHVGYQFRGSTAKPSPHAAMPEQPHYGVGSMRWHEVRLGLTYRF